MSGQNNEANNLYLALKSLDQSEIKSNLQIFSSYLTKLTNELSPNKLSEKMIYEWTFKNVLDLKKSRDIDCYFRCNLISAKKSLGRIIENLSKIEVDEYQKRILKDFVCDLKPFIMRFDSEQDYEWLVGNTNAHITNFYFQLLSNTFWTGNVGQHPEEKKVLSSSSPFLIRQAIEYKIKRVLGIDYIMLNSKPDNKMMDKCFKAIESNKDKGYYSTKFEFDILKKIYRWTHVYIHGGYRPEPWKTETAINYLSLFFYSGLTTDSNLFSLYAAVEVKATDIESLKANTVKIIEQEAASNTLKIVWTINPEIAIV